MNDLKELRIWKISHGKSSTMTKDDHEILLANNLVAVNFSEATRGYTNFKDTPEGGYFYLVRNAKIVLWGQFLTSEITSVPEKLSKEGWTAKRIKKIKVADYLVKRLSENMQGNKHWLPTGQSTVTEVPTKDIEAFEEGILKPVFNLSVANLTEKYPLSNSNNQKNMNNSLNRILYGSPGTGKTYSTVIHALMILEGETYESKNNKDYKDQKNRFDKFKKNGQIEFVTFHQSFSYEDFVEGIRAVTDSGQLSYVIEPGIFKRIADKALNDKDNKKYVLIIDEINRGNMSRIFGELITLIEPNKRLGNDEAITVKLPYSKSNDGHEDFGVPNNLYIIGTMNTADRSLALMDTALRRRFDFIEMMPKPELIIDNDDKKPIQIDGVNIQEMLSVINQRIEALYDREHTIGHAFFMGLKNDSKIDDLANIFKNKILPLLEEYFFEDWEKITKVLGQSNIYEKHEFSKLEPEYSGSAFRKNVDALKEPETYINIYTS